jgi:hypothetical protein
VTDLPPDDANLRRHLTRGTRMLADHASVESLVDAARAALEPRA